jgi:hypothetical protein
VKKSAGALRAHRARWDPFVNTRASSADLAKLSNDGLGARARHFAKLSNDGLGARAQHTSRAVDLIQI